MLNFLPNDIFLKILYNFKNIKELLRLSETDKNINLLMDDNLYFNWGKNLYTKKCWKKAKNLDSIISKPLKNMKLELIRIEKFQDYNIKHGYQRWENKDFFIYWENLEKNKII